MGFQVAFDLDGACSLEKGPILVLDPFASGNWIRLAAHIELALLILTAFGFWTRQ